MKQPGIICVFVKQPRPGRVKTRLAKALGQERAAELAAAFFADTLETVESFEGCRIVLAVAPDDYRASEDHELWPQGDGDLGARMERTAARALAQAPWVIIVGTDSPGMPHHLLDDAIASLEADGGPEAVIGPSHDGGFYTLGLRRFCSLSPVRWSTPSACADTRAALARAGLSTLLLAPWFDVDEPRDLARLVSSIESGLVRAAHTAALVAGG